MVLCETVAALACWRFYFLGGQARRSRALGAYMNAWVDCGGDMQAAATIGYGVYDITKSWPMHEAVRFVVREVGFEWIEDARVEA